MRSYITTGLALVAGFGLGAVTIDGLHAQSKPPLYVVTEIDISNMDRYMKDYAPKAQELVKKGGGRLLSATTNITALEGKAPPRFALHQWDSMEKIKAWHGSAEYKENRKLGDKLAKFRIYVVEGRPQ
jgi:uncharacterized protein (DUF1330 family)